MAVRLTFIQVFKAPEEAEDHAEEATGIPLLAGQPRRSLDEEEEALLYAEGPNSAGRGTLLEGVANVSLHARYRE